MKLGSKHKADPSFNMSSMTDVVFLLLIFFIMTSSNITPIGKKMNLPKSKNDNNTITIQRVAVSVDKDGNLFVDDDPATQENMLSMIESKLSPKHEDKHKNNIVVRGDVEVSYGRVMEVAEICAEVQNASVTLQMEPR